MLESGEVQSIREIAELENLKEPLSRARGETDGPRAKLRRRDP